MIIMLRELEFYQYDGREETFHVVVHPDGRLEYFDCIGKENRIRYACDAVRVPAHLQWLKGWQPQRCQLAGDFADHANEGEQWVLTYRDKGRPICQFRGNDIHDRDIEALKIWLMDLRVELIENGIYYNIAANEPNQYWRLANCKILVETEMGIGIA
ncbi:MAG TPA: hypothetical protein DEA67_05575 [Selenomonas sp.]|nr:hypothetical protein [Selenomonas sp.]